MIAALGRLWRWIIGANRQRQYRSAVDVYIEQADERLEEIACLLDVYEERVTLLAQLQSLRQRTDSGEEERE